MLRLSQTESITGKKSKKKKINTIGLKMLYHVSKTERGINMTSIKIISDSPKTTENQFKAMELMMEIDRLLTEVKISHRIFENQFGYLQILILNSGSWDFSIICHPGSYGFPNALELGRLDVDGKGVSEITGFLAPEEVLYLIKKQINQIN